MMMWNFKMSLMGSWLMMSKTDVTEAVLSLEVFHGGAKFIDVNHNQPQHIPADSFLSCLLFPKVCSTRSGKRFPKRMESRLIKDGLKQKTNMRHFVWEDQNVLKSAHLLKRFSHFQYFLKSIKSVLMETKIVTKC